MKKALLSALIVIFLYLASVLLKIDPSRTLITIMAYWLFMDHLEKEDEE